MREKAEKEEQRREEQRREEQHRREVDWLLIAHSIRPSGKSRLLAKWSKSACEKKLKKKSRQREKPKSVLLNKVPHQSINQ